MKKIYIIVLASILLFPASSFAAAPKVSDVGHPLAQVLIGVVVALAICIVVLANVVLSAAQVHLKKFKETEKKSNNTATKITTLVVFMLFSSALFANDVTAAVTATDNTIAGLQSSSFYGLIGSIIAELVILFFLIANLKFLLKAENISLTTAIENEVEKQSSLEKWWDKVNSFKSLKEEAQIDLGHDYDGIRELDNRLPRWWLYGFYLCIIAGCIYLWRFHVSHTGLSSKEELQLALEQGEKDKAEYLKNAANNVDENTVTLLTSEADIAAGKTVFLANCIACHGETANGLVNGNPGAGPNLIDNYWLHKGSVQDIFKTIKYGWPEKGMKSWKEDIAPTKIAQLVAFIKSMQGKDDKGKAPQGDLFEENNVSDSTKKAVIDSTTVIAKEETKK